MAQALGATSAREEVFSPGEQDVSFPQEKGLKTSSVKTTVQTFKQTAETHPYTASKTVCLPNNRV